MPNQDLENLAIVPSMICWSDNGPPARPTHAVRQARPNIHCTNGAQVQVAREEGRQGTVPPPDVCYPLPAHQFVTLLASRAATEYTFRLGSLWRHGNQLRTPASSGCSPDALQCQDAPGEDQSIRCRVVDDAIMCRGSSGTLCRVSGSMQYDDTTVIL